MRNERKPERGPWVVVALFFAFLAWGVLPSWAGGPGIVDSKLLAWFGGAGSTGGAPTDNYVWTYDSATGNAGWEAASGGGSNALLDGSNHTDTAAQAVSRGSLVFGNSTPAWDELTIGSAGTVVGSDGTDVSWVSSSVTVFESFTALDGIAYPSTTTFATLETRNGRRHLAFGDSVEESVLFEGTLPETYSGGTVTVELWTAAETATSGDAVWQVEWERFYNDLDADDFATGATVTITAAGTAGVPTAGTVTFTQAVHESQAGEPYRLLVWRRGDDSDGAGLNDDMTGDAELYRVTVRE